MMSTVILCDKCNDQIHTKPHVWGLAADTITATGKDVDLCGTCWKQLSDMVWNKIFERQRE